MPRFGIISILHCYRQSLDGDSARQFLRYFPILRFDHNVIIRTLSTLNIGGGRLAMNKRFIGISQAFWIGAANGPCIFGAGSLRQADALRPDRQVRAGVPRDTCQLNVSRLVLIRREVIGHERVTVRPLANNAPTGLFQTVVSLKSYLSKRRAGPIDPLIPYPRSNEDAHKIWQMLNSRLLINVAFTLRDSRFLFFRFIYGFFLRRLDMEELDRRKRCRVFNSSLDSTSLACIKMPGNEHKLRVYLYLISFSHTSV